jgi:hypothetical protein
VRDDLQDVVDEVARLLGAPATLEDTDFTLLAFAAHPLDDAAAMDAVRTRSILGRGSTPATRRWFEALGIARAPGPLRTPADPAAGILTRLLLPVRHGGRTLGYLWLLDGGRTDPDDGGDPALARALDLADRAGQLLARRREDDDLAAALTALLAGPAAERERAGAVLAARFDGGAVTLVALRPAGGAPPQGWRLPPGAAVLGDGVVLAVPRPVDPCAAAATVLARLPAGSRAGVSEPATAVADLPGRWAQARAAAAVAAVVPRLAPVASWAGLGGWRAAAALPAPDPAVAALLGEPVLATTAEAYLDAAGSPARTSAALGIHRQTLYSRLGRITALTGLDLADGDTRLLVHASLRRAHLP